MSFLELHEVSKIYNQGSNEIHALRSVELSVDAGSLVAVMGPSGSGKSTLLTIAGSLEEPTSGEVMVGGARLSTMSRNAKARLRRRSIGYVFQDFNLLPGLTAVENVSLPLELDGLAARKAARPAWQLWRSWDSPIALVISPTSCREANANAWRSRVRWWEIAGCFSQTSRPVLSTP